MKQGRALLQGPGPRRIRRGRRRRRHRPACHFTSHVPTVSPLLSRIVPPCPASSGSNSVTSRVSANLIARLASAADFIAGLPSLISMVSFSAATRVIMTVARPCGYVLARCAATGCLVGSTGGDLTGARLESARITSPNLTGADLTRALLGGADFTRADLTGARHTDAYLEGAKGLPAGTLIRRRPAAPDELVGGQAGCAAGSSPPPGRAYTALGRVLNPGE